MRGGRQAAARGAPCAIQRCADRAVGQPVGGRSECIDNSAAYIDDVRAADQPAASPEPGWPYRPVRSYRRRPKPHPVSPELDVDRESRPRSIRRTAFVVLDLLTSIAVGLALMMRFGRPHSGVHLPVYAAVDVSIPLVWVAAVALNRAFLPTALVLNLLGRYGARSPRAPARTEHPDLEGGLLAAR